MVDKNKLMKLISETLKVKVEEVKEDSDFEKDFEVDDVDRAHMAINIEDQFNIQIPDDEWEKIKTVKDLIESFKKGRSLIDKEKLKRLISEILKIDVEKIKEDSDFENDLGMDSLNKTEMVINIENQFGIQIPDREVEHMRTVGSLINYLRLFSMRPRMFNTRNLKNEI